jgi:predicted ribosomally synthesized six-cysteine peptide SCIFF
MKLIQPLFRGELALTAKSGGCGECKNSCQSACKTSCTVGNQVCQKRVVSRESKVS